MKLNYLSEFLPGFKSYTYLGLTILFDHANDMTVGTDKETERDKASNLALRTSLKW